MGLQRSADTYFTHLIGRLGVCAVRYGMADGMHGCSTGSVWAGVWGWRWVGGVL